MPKDKVVVGSPAAAAVAQELGFTNVFGLDHGKTISVCNDKIQITGTAGGRVQLAPDVCCFNATHCSAQLLCAARACIICISRYL